MSVTTTPQKPCDHIPEEAPAIASAYSASVAAVVASETESEARVVRVATCVWSSSKLPRKSITPKVATAMRRIPTGTPTRSCPFSAMSRKVRNEATIVVSPPLRRRIGLPFASSSCGSAAALGGPASSSRAFFFFFLGPGLGAGSEGSLADASPLPSRSGAEDGAPAGGGGTGAGVEGSAGSAGASSVGLLSVMDKWGWAPVAPVGGRAGRRAKGLATLGARA